MGLPWFDTNLLSFEELALWFCPNLLSFEELVPWFCPNLPIFGELAIWFVPTSPVLGNLHTDIKYQFHPVPKSGENPSLRLIPSYIYTMQYPNSLTSKIFCSDLVGLIYSFIYQRCQRCKNIKDSDLFKKTKKNKIVQICNECSIVVKKIKTIKGELFNEIENQGNIRNGDILKIKFDRFMYDKALFEKTVNNYIRGRYAHLEYSIYDDMDEFYKVRIVDPNNIRYKTEQFFKRNFVNMKENPQTVFQLTQMEQPLNAALGNNFSNVKKLKIETEMFMYIMKKISGVGRNSGQP